MQKVSIISGIILILTGVLWPVLSKIPLGRLPGDIIIDKPNIKIYLPFMTMLLISLLISIILKLFKK